jgi:DNA-binding transcriptional LysR family regulator
MPTVPDDAATVPSRKLRVADAAPARSGDNGISLMHRSELADVIVFVAVAEHLSFRVAASRLGVTPSAVSHAMRQLEDRRGVRLLHRTTRSVSLTDAGFRLLEQLRPALSQITGALNNLNNERDQPLGNLRIYTTHTAASAVIAPIWGRFLAAYPDVNLELRVDETPIDIVAKGFDAGIGPRERVASDMIAVRVMEPVKVAVVGATSYFARRRPPRTPEDLVDHHCIKYRMGADGAILEWLFKRNGKSHRLSVEGRVIVSNGELAVRAAADGLGIAYTLEPWAAPLLRSGQLVRVLEDWSPSFEGLFLYYPGHRQVPAALRALIDMIRTPSPATPTISTDNPFMSDLSGE